MQNLNNNKMVLTHQECEKLDAHMTKFIEHGLPYIKQVEINPHQPHTCKSAHKLIEQALTLLYRENLPELLKQWEERYRLDKVNKCIMVEYGKYHNPVTLGEWCATIYDLCQLLGYIEEYIKMGWSQHGDGIFYGAHTYEQMVDKARKKYPQVYSKQYTPEQESILKKNYESDNVVWSDQGVEFSIHLAFLAEDREVYLDNVGENLLWLKKLWQPTNSMSMRLCAWPVLAQTQGIVRWLMYIVSKHLQVAKLKNQQQGGDWNTLMNSDLTIYKNKNLFNIYYVIALVKQLEERVMYHVLTDALWSPQKIVSGLCHTNYSFLNEKYHDFQGTIYGKYQQLGSWESLTQYVWERNPLLSQEFEDNVEYFSPYNLELPDTIEPQITQISEWLLFANIPNIPSNHQWLLWRQQIRKFVQIISDNYNLQDIQVLIETIYSINNAKLLGHPYSELEVKLKNMLCQINHSDSWMNVHDLPHWWIQLTKNSAIYEHEKELSKSLLLLRAKLLAAPYQYGDIGWRLHIWEGERSHLHYDR